MSTKFLITFALVLGGLGILIGFGNKHADMSVAGAVLLAGGLIAQAINETKSS